MAYQLKSTGIAANCITCLAVDPDTNTVKDFASSSVTADLLVGANVTTGSQTWDGITRHYFRPGSGTADADFVKFGTNKPSFTFNASNTQRTVVFIGEVAGGAVRLFGNSSADYFAGNNLGAGGATHPTAIVSSSAIGATGAGLVSGNKRIFAWSLVRGGASNSSFIYSAADIATTNDITLKTVGNLNVDYALTHINRRNDSTSHQQDKTHAILVFDTALTEAQIDSLRDDWFTVLLEAAGAGSHNLVAGSCTLDSTSGTGAITQDHALVAGSCTLTSVSGTGAITLGAAHNLVAGSCTLSSTSGTGAISQVHSLVAGTCTQTYNSGTGAITVDGVGTLTTLPCKNNGGYLLANETGITLYISNPTTGVLVLKVDNRTSDASGIIVITHASLVPGTTYRMVIKLSNGAEGLVTLVAT